jgi:hypothetical protein
VERWKGRRLDRRDGRCLRYDVRGLVIHDEGYSLDSTMTTSQWSKSGDARWYLGVRCRKCRTPILFGLDRTEGVGEVMPAGKLVLTCSKPECRHQADYSGAKVARFQKTLNPR